MNTLENRVREAARAVAETVPASTVPPLRVAGTSACGWPASRRWGRWLAPVAAAAAVIVVAALLVAVRGGFGPGAGASPPASGGVTTGPDGAPPYYVSSNATAFFAPSNAVVKDTTTGATLGTIKPSVPGDTISAVTAAADDRTFVLAEDKWVGMNSTSFQYYETRSFYLLRLNSDGRPASVTRLPMTAGPLVTGIALSPDGTRLAIAVHPVPATGPTAAAQQTQLRVYTLASGAVRTWYANGTIGSPPIDPGSISWTASGQQLAFDWSPDSQGEQDGTWLLTLARGGTSLLADSRQVMSTHSPKSPPSCGDDQIVTPDGSAVICPSVTVLGRAKGHSHIEVTFLEYSTATGRRVRTIAFDIKKATGIPAANVLWSNATGSVFIGAIPNVGNGRAGIVRGGTFTPIPMPPNTDPYYLGAW